MVVRSRATADRVTAFIGLSVLCTLAPARASAFRTFEDDPEVGEAARMVGDEVVWDLASPPLSRDTAEAVESATSRAFSAWTALECSGVSARFAGALALPGLPADGRNTITLVATDWEAVGAGSLRPATADVQLMNSGAGWYIAEVDIYVDVENWTWDELGGPSGSLSLEGVLAHEVGHLFGLLHPCEDDVSGLPACGDEPRFAASLMHPVYGGPRTPSAEDVGAFCRLYPVTAPPCGGLCGAGEMCLDGRCEPSCEDGGCTSSCVADDDCPMGDGCAVAGPHVGRCVTAGGRGTECDVGEECASALCLSSRWAASYCTVSCLADESCGSDERCVEVEARRVCAPRVPAQTCSHSPHTRSNLTAAATSLLLLTVVMRSRRRQRWNPT